jgi:3',5'-cyclic AMP phosphodiesterase CpdA
LDDDKILRIAHISDTHISPYGGFIEKEFDNMIAQINLLKPDLVIHSGDITHEGLLEDYKLAKEKLSLLEPDMIILPGNHDARNLGHTIYPNFFGSKNVIKKVEDIGICALDTSVPDIDEGRLGRTGQDHMKKLIEDFFGLVKIISIHHHLIPVPEAGRARNMIDDAGDVLKLVTEENVDLILMGHRHVPYITKVENTIMTNAGTLSARKTRGYHGHSFNLIHLDHKVVKIEIIKLFEKKLEIEYSKEYKITH